MLINLEVVKIIQDKKKDIKQVAALIFHNNQNMMLMKQSIISWILRLIELFFQIGCKLVILLGMIQDGEKRKKVVVLKIHYKMMS